MFQLKGGGFILYGKMAEKKSVFVKKYRNYFSWFLQKYTYL